LGNVLTNIKNDSAAEFKVGSRGANTGNVVANPNPRPKAIIVWKGTLIPTEVPGLRMQSNPAPNKVAAHPMRFFDL
jgi:hypothetical protein